MLKQLQKTVITKNEWMESVRRNLNIHLETEDKNSWKIREQMPYIFLALLLSSNIFI